MNRKQYSVFVKSTLKAIEELVEDKQVDYADENDALSNFRKGEKFGVSPLLSVWLRMQDKQERVDNYIINGQLKNEGIEDAFKDLIGYSLLALATMTPVEVDLDSASPEKVKKIIDKEFINMYNEKQLLGTWDGEIPPQLKKYTRED